MSSSTTSGSIENRLLAVLPRDEYEPLLPQLEPIRLAKYRILFEAGEPMPYAYFLNSGMATMLAITENGQTVEIAMLGDESFIGIPIIHQAATTFCRVMTQTQADAVRVEAGVLLAEFKRGGKLQDLLLLRRSRNRNADGPGIQLQPFPQQLSKSLSGSLSDRRLSARRCF